MLSPHLNKKKYILYIIFFMQYLPNNLVVFEGFTSYSVSYDSNSLINKNRRSRYNLIKMFSFVLLFLFFIISI